MQNIRFVVFTDTHINASETETASPWPINRLANARARAAVLAINALEPDFAIHLGDVVQPLPGHAGFEEASSRASDILGNIDCPLWVVPGNHDVGDKPLQWNPADLVTDAFVEVFRSTQGDDRVRFEHGGCVFLGINAQLINSEFLREEEQWAWLENALSSASGKRVFLFLHYPPFIYHPDEHEHYDNLGEPGRGRLLDLLRAHRVEACFSGHVHNFFYNRIGETRSYTLPAVSFVRHDYSELFSVSPQEPSFGRDDRAKLGFIVVDVDETGHTVRLVRSHGATEPEAGTGNKSAGAFVLPDGGSRKTGGKFGATLRHDWARVHGISPSGAVDAFRRKPARDDYFVSALWECGLTQLRVPIDDLLCPDRIERLRLLADDGFRVSAFCYGIPDEATREALRSVSGAALEIIAPIEDLERDISSLEALSADVSRGVHASPLRPRHDSAGAKAFIHSIRHGFLPDEKVPAFLAQSALAGLCFSARHDDDPASQIPRCAERATQMGKTAQIHVALGSPNPADMEQDIAHATERVQAAYAAAHAAPPGTSVWVDTSVDVDRGYFPRLSLIDRRSNPTTLGRSVADLAARLGRSDN